MLVLVELVAVSISDVCDGVGLMLVQVGVRTALIGWMMSSYGRPSLGFPRKW